MPPETGKMMNRTTHNNINETILCVAGLLYLVASVFLSYLVFCSSVLRNFETQPLTHNTTIIPAVSDSFQTHSSVTFHYSPTGVIAFIWHTYVNDLLK